MAAARSGAGVVSIAGSPEALATHAAHVSYIMLKPVSTMDGLRDLLEDTRIRTFCIGPAAGLDVSTRKAVMRVLRCQAPAVLDADALSVFEEDPQSLFLAISKRNAPTVLTPHEGEFQRLFGSIELNAENKVERARAAARASGAIVLYKGPDTVIAHPGGQAVINGNGGPGLAVAGSGDVLAGIITGLLAQGMDGFAAACAGAWLHAEAGNRCIRPVAEDLVEAL